ncbi:DciA family protein, partial [Nostocoides japonicum]|uniref:DciA family protein n=1 Tax=Nostocoides japonicum TaxID=99481 RepID=UPI0009F99D14
AVARSKGLRPGSRPSRRRQDVPADARHPVGGRDPRDGRDPHLLGEEVETFIAERGWEVDVAAGSVIGRWSAIVGPQIAQHCAPVSFELGVLVVRAESTAWATQLRLLASSLLARLAAEAGEGVVTELRIVGPSARSWTHGPRVVSDGRGPRDTYG